MRKYYEDPLAAAWMAKHFGMKFKSARGQNMYFDGGSDFRTEKDCGFYAGEYYHIHPSSLHILEPMAGDVGTVYNGHAANFRDGYWEHNDGQREPASEGKIIQRQGIPFHWPLEQTDAN